MFMDRGKAHQGYFREEVAFLGKSGDVRNKEMDGSRCGPLLTCLPPQPPSPPSPSHSDLRGKVGWPKPHSRLGAQTVLGLSL